MKKLSLLLALVFNFTLIASEILLLRGTSSGPQGTPQAVLDRAAERLATVIRDAGIACDVESDSALTAELLAERRLLVFPANDKLPDDALALLDEFLAKGGKLLVFGSSDAKLLSRLGISEVVRLARPQLGAVSGIYLGKERWEGAPGSCVFQAIAPLFAPKLAADAEGAKIVGNTVPALENGVPQSAVVLNPHGIYCGFTWLDQHYDGRSLIVSAICHFLPELWAPQNDRLRIRLDTICQNGLAADGSPRPLDEQLLESFPALRSFYTKLLALRKLADEAEGAQAFDTLSRACVLARVILAQAAPSRAGEMRGAWIHYPGGTAGLNWEETVAPLALAGCNALFPNFCWAYNADYHSNVLPVHPQVAGEGKTWLADCLDACHKHGLEVHIWKVCWNMGERTPKRLRRQMQEAGRTQKTWDGKDTDYLAPHLPENQDLEVAACLELVRNYAIDGIHLDYIRYPNLDCDYSDSARHAFETSLGRPVANWPQDCRPDGQDFEAFLQWKRDNISRLVERIHREVKAIRPDLKISTAVYGNWENARTAVAQDARLWAENGWVDFLCPMNYEAKLEDFRRWTAQQTAAVGHLLPIYAGIGVWLLPDAASCVQQIQAARQLGAAGYIFFQQTPKLADQMLPLVAKGANSLPAGSVLPHHHPQFQATVKPPADKNSLCAYRLGETYSCEIAIPGNIRIATLKHTLLRDGLYPLPDYRTQIFRTAQGVRLKSRPPEPGFYTWKLEAEDSFGQTWLTWGPSFQVTEFTPKD